MAPAQPPSPPLAERLQQALGGSCLLGQPLGEGGFGVVYAARDLRLARDVAVKVLRPELAAPVLRERFRREAEAIAGLRHPGIIAIHDVGERGDLCWFVMPLIQGRTLRARLEAEGRLPVGEARRVLEEVAAALSAAHARGLVHRDIKPENILLDGDEQRAVLTDFGIAKSLGETGSGPSLTTAGLIVGTPDYMSPEQAGGGGVVDARSDLYALGVVGYELLTGQRPFRGPTPMAVLMQQLGAPPAPIASLRRECPPALSDAVERCLKLEPRERWESAQAFRAALRRSGALARPVTAGMEGAAGRGEPRRFRRLALGVAGLLLAGAVVDLSRGAAVLSPIIALVGGSLLAVRFGTLWTRGFAWRALWRAPAPAPAPGLPAGDPASQARSDRATILRCYAAFPRAEQQALPGLPAQVDELVAVCEALASQPQAAARERLARAATALATIRSSLLNAGSGGLASIAPVIRPHLHVE